jgi:hypothetical protein
MSLHARIVSDYMVTNDIRHRIRLINKSSDLNERMELMGHLLQYLVHKRSYMTRYRRFRATILTWCLEWVDADAAASIREQIILAHRVLVVL